MAKVRLGVVLLIPPPLEREIDTLRRAVGDGTYGRVPAHLTLVPPTNVNQERFHDVMDVLRDAAAPSRPFCVHLGAPTTFLPANPVLYLPLVGEGRAAVFALRERVFRDPLARPLTWPFVPHVTIADETDVGRINAAEAALSSYAAEVTFDRVHLLQEGPGRVWAPVADARFGPPAVVGRGGIELHMTMSQGLDPGARSFSDGEWDVYTSAEGFDGRDPDEPNLALVARRRGQIVGVAEGWARGGVAYLANLIVARSERRQGIGSHLLAAFESEAHDRGCARLAADVWAGTPAEAFYRSRGWVEESRRRGWFGDRDLLHLQRHG